LPIQKSEIRSTKSETSTNVQSKNMIQTDESLEFW